MMPQTRSTPILMYHKVGQPVMAPRDMFLNVPTETFANQMRTLARLGFRCRTFAEIVNTVSRGRTMPARTFAITFDDGYTCIEENAAPILAAHSFPATVFVVSSLVGSANMWDRVDDNPVLPLMDWPALRRLTAAGWEMGGHTRSHPHLDVMDSAGAYGEILDGKQEIEAELGRRLETFCYPFGHFRWATPALVRSAGFRGACTTRSGLTRKGMDPFLLPRVKVAYRDGVAGLLYRLMLRPRLPNLRRRRRADAAAR